MQAQALKPRLYSIPPDAATSPRLAGGRCQCGHVFFPMQTYGCEVCGATGDALQPAELPAQGTLVASSRVLMHARKDREPPYVVVSVRLDDGPVIRTLLDEDTTDVIPVNAPLRGRLVEVARTEDGASVVDLRFARVR
jgi:uncharacterized OB-fold protein